LKSPSRFEIRNSSPVRPITWTRKFLGRRLTGKPSDSKPEILGSNPGAPANSRSNSFRKGSLTGKAVVPKTTAHVSLAGSSPVPSANFNGPVAQGNESATLRRSRTHVQIVPGPPIKKSYGVAELERRESLKLVYVGSNPTSVARFAGVAQSGGGASLRN
jgi:hypothetical protein